MNKREFIAAVAARIGSDKKTAEAAVAAVINTIQDAVAVDEPVVLTGFGTFRRGEQSARQGVSSLTGKPYHSPAKFVPKFSAGAEFKELVAAGGGQREHVAA